MPFQLLGLRLYKLQSQIIEFCSTPVDMAFRTFPGVFALPSPQRGGLGFACDHPYLRHRKHGVSMFVAQRLPCGLGGPCTISLDVTASKCSISVQRSGCFAYDPED